MMMCYNISCKIMYIKETDMEPKEYQVIKIEGEYATLKDINSGEELFITLFLLPEEIDIGTHLHYEALQYEIID